MLNWRKKEAEQSQNTLQKQVLRKEKDTKVLRSKLTCARAKKDKYYKLYLQANRSNVQLKKKIHSDEIKLTTLQKQSEQDHAELNELKSKFRECEQSLHYLQGLIDDSSEIELFDKSSYKYTTETIMCVMNLTNLKKLVMLSGKFQNCVVKSQTLFLLQQLLIEL